MKKTVLITGVAGFIGYSLAENLANNTNYTVVGIDNINDYYDTKLKYDRLTALNKKITFYKIDLNDDLTDIFKQFKFDCVINLAAQAGVRYAKQNPDSYIRSNIDGFYNLMRTAQKFNVDKVIYASSSSVYGANTALPFKESDPIATPMSLYAATKASNESLASGFYYSYGIRTIGLRFFNIYGPFGRPDMAYFKWANILSEGGVVELNNEGNMWRDMTYIDDCIKSIGLLIEDTQRESFPEVYNIGNKTPVKISDLLTYISKKLDTSPRIKTVAAGVEEPIKTWADTDRLQQKIGFIPNTDFRSGVDVFINWYKGYYDK